MPNGWKLAVLANHVPNHTDYLVSIWHHCQMEKIVDECLCVHLASWIVQIACQKVGNWQCLQITCQITRISWWAFGIIAKWKKSWTNVTVCIWHHCQMRHPHLAQLHTNAKSTCFIWHDCSKCFVVIAEGIINVVNKRTISLHYWISQHTHSFNVEVIRIQMQHVYFIFICVNFCTCNVKNVCF